MIALVDYGAGNLTSVKKALRAIGAEAIVPEQPSDLADARGIIVPGVGHFGATRALTADWIEAILARVGEGRPLLGICLGMQWLFEGSDEAPDCPGLGLLAGRCYRLRGAEVKVPHIGWNRVDISRPSAILGGVPDATQFYFVHSFVAPKWPTPGTMTPRASARSDGAAGTTTSAPMAPSALRTDVRLPAP